MSDANMTWCSGRFMIVLLYRDLWLLRWHQLIRLILQCMSAWCLCAAGVAAVSITILANQTLLCRVLSAAAGGPRAQLQLHHRTTAATYRRLAKCVLVA